MLPVGSMDDKFKTELCVKYLDMGQCPYGLRCRFAHGEEELRAKPKPRTFRPTYTQQGSIGGTQQSGVYGVGSGMSGMGSTATTTTNTTTTTIPTSTAISDTNSGQYSMQSEHLSTQMMSDVPHRMSGMIQRPPGPLDPDTRDELQARATAQWEAMMPIEWMDPTTGLFSLAPLDGYNECRPNISERFQAWKELRAEGPLPDHVLILKDNLHWREKCMREEDAVLSVIGLHPLHHPHHHPPFPGGLIPSHPHPSHHHRTGHPISGTGNNNGNGGSQSHNHAAATSNTTTTTTTIPTSSIIAASMIGGATTHHHSGAKDLNGPAPAPGMGPMVGGKPYERKDERSRQSDRNGGHSDATNHASSSSSSRKRKSRDDGGVSGMERGGSSRSRRRRNNDDHYDAGSDAGRYERDHYNGGGTATGGSGRSRSSSDHHRRKSRSENTSHFARSPIPVRDDR